MPRVALNSLWSLGDSTWWCSSASQVAGITGRCHQAQPGGIYIFILLENTKNMGNMFGVSELWRMLSNIFAKMIYRCIWNFHFQSTEHGACCTTNYHLTMVFRVAVNADNKHLLWFGKDLRADWIWILITISYLLILTSARKQKSFSWFF